MRKSYKEASSMTTGLFVLLLIGGLLAMTACNKANDAENKSDESEHSSKLLTRLFAYEGYVYDKKSNKWLWSFHNTTIGGGSEIGIGADVNTFEVIEMRIHKNVKTKAYAKDKNSVFYKGQRIAGLDPYTLQFLDENGEVNTVGYITSPYTKDINHVYRNKETIIGADPVSWRGLGGGYSRDDKHIYSGMLPLLVDHPEEFKVTDFSDGSITFPIESFLERNPEYQWLKDLNLEEVPTGLGKGETTTQKFYGHKEIKSP